jgi:demethylmenaquinone methyltransferase/2-methoxy-6-polyprenyl-1,4-benzoquinol methylase
MGYGLRYLGDVPGALRQIRGTLRPGGLLVTLDFGLPEPGWYRSLCLGYLFVFGTIWGLALHGKADTYWHIVESLRAYPGQRALAGMLVDAGFGPVAILEDLGGISVTVHAERAGDLARGQERVDRKLDALGQHHGAAGTMTPPIGAPDPGAVLGHGDEG